MMFLDFLFPKYCVSCRKIGSYVCADCFAHLSFSQKTMCFLCGKYAIDGLTHPMCDKNSLDGCFIALEYTAVAKKLIYVSKYKPYVHAVSEVMSELFYEGLIQKEALMRLLATENNRILMPIPLHAKKQRSRGYNHAAILGKEVVKKLHMTFVDTLIRVKETRVQFGLTKEERKKNMKDVFAIKNEKNSKDVIVFLIDDIVTTGVTFVEAAKVLKKAGAKKVYGLAFAGEN